MSDNNNNNDTANANATANADSGAGEERKPLRKVNRPNEQAYRDKQDRVSAQIDQAKGKLSEVLAALDKITGPRPPRNASKSGDGAPSKSGSDAGAGAAPAAPMNPAQEIREKLKALQKVIRAEIARAKALRAEADALSGRRKALLDDAKRKRSELEFTKSEDIDREISRLEDRVAHTSMSITEEKKVVAKIGQLKGSKAKVAEQAKASEEISKLEESRKAVIAKSRTVSDEITRLKGEEDALRAKLEKANEEIKAKRADVPGLLKRKDELRKQISGLFDQRTKNREEHNAAFGEYKAYLKEADRIYKEKKDAERAERAARAAEGGDAGSDDEGSDAEADASSAWAQEIGCCGDLLAYLGTLEAKRDRIVAAAKGSADAAGDAAAKDNKALEGLQVMGNKHKRAGGAFINLGKGGSGKKKGQGGAAGKEGSLDSALTHGFNVLLYYSTVGLKAPKTLRDVEKSIQEVKERKAHYLSDPPKPEKDAKDAEGKGTPKKKAAKKENPGAVSADDEAKDGSGPKPATATALPTGAWANRVKA